MPKNQKLKSFPAANEKIFVQLERMLSSPDFHATPQQVNFLKYVVGRALSGDADQIKAYTVAMDVFGRGPDFEQSIDPVVSIQAGRLRRAIERYYLTTGQHDPIRIDIPKGTYVPVFSEQLPRNRPIAAEKTVTVRVMETFPVVLVRPPVNLTDSPEDNYLSIGLATELAHALSHFKEIRILKAHQHNQESTPRETDIDFTIDGNVRRDPTGIRLAVRLCDAKKGIQVWSGKYQGDLEAAKLISFQEEVAAEIAVRVAGDNALISKHLAGVSRNKAVSELSTYEAMLRFWESDTRHTPQSYRRAIQALEKVLDRNPDYGQAWSMLASLYADNYGLEIVDLPTPLEKAVQFAQSGVSLDPTSRRARVILGHVRLMENKLQEARCEAETAYNLCPDSLVVLDVIGWVIARAGEWERGVNWIKKAIKLNPYYRPWIRSALWANWFREGNYEKAYQETLSFKMPDLFWEPIMKASTLGHLGRIEAGQVCVQNLLALKPDFAQRGRILIGRYAKFEDLIDRIIEGLGKLDLRVES